MGNTKNLNAPLVASNQAQKEVTVNTALSIIDIFLNNGVIEKGLNTPPSEPQMGDIYIVGDNPTDQWSDNASDIAYYLTSWNFITPNEGMTLWVNNEKKLYIFNGSEWVLQFYSPKNLNNKIELIAHRGFADSYPQNTMLAMSGALQAGADSLECDVQPSADGDLYLFHDTSVDSLTDGTGSFTSLSSSTIDGLTFDELAGTDYSGERIPTFEAFLKFAKQKGVYIYPEIKKIISNQTIDDIVQAIIDAGMENQSMLQSFNLSDLQRVRATNSVIAVGYLGSSTTQSTYEAAIDAMAALEGETAILWSGSSLISTPAIVNYAKSKKIDVGTWTIDDNSSVRDLAEIGVNKIMSDVNIGEKNTHGVSVATSNIKDLTEVIAGSGTISISGDVATINDPDTTSSSAYLLKRVSVQAGETITASCKARLISGSGGSAPGIGLDYPNFGSLKTHIQFDSPYWKDYSISYTIPQTHDNNGSDHARFIFGSWTSKIGEAEISDIKIEVSNSGLSFPRVFANALVQISSGVSSLNSNFVNQAIKNVSYNLGTKQLTLTVEPSGANGINAAPVFHVNLTGDNNLNIVAKWKGYNRQAGTVIVEFIDMSLATPTTVDISSLGTLYLSVLGLG